MTNAVEMQHTGVSRARSGPIESGIHSQDDSALARLGKKPVLKRNFGFMAILGFSCTVLITWEGTLVLFLSGFQNGGPAGVIYGYIIVWLGTFSVFATLSELASMAPTSGGQYHWVSMLAPPSTQRFLSYITGWLTVAGWQAFLASGAYLTATMIQGLIVLVDPVYEYATWHGTLLFWAVILFCVAINTFISGLLPKFEGIILVLHLLGFFAILLPLVLLGPHDTAPDVFSSFLNEGGWQTQELSFFIGLLGNVFAFFGADGAFHMSEEIVNAAVVVPRSIMFSVIINGILGFGMVIAVLFCLGDIDQALNTPTGYPFIEIFYQATGSLAGSAIMTCIIIALSLCATVGIMASASRMLWAFARDDGVPYSAWLQKLNPRTTLPVPAILVTTAIPCLLALINIGSTTAFNAVVSLSVAALFASYLIAASLLLWRRCTGSIVFSYDPETRTNTVYSPITWGPWRLPGILGILNNGLTCVYLVIILFFSFWPTVDAPLPSQMNYTCLMLGVTMIFSAGYYFIWARKTYRGPAVDMIS